MAMPTTLPVAAEAIGSALPTPAPAAETVPGEVERRLLSVAHSLLEGKSARDIIAGAQLEWGVSRRTAQLYVQKVRRRLARDAIAEDRTFYLRLSQLQRDKVLGLALRYAEHAEQIDPKVLRAVTGMLSAACKLLDSRDRTATALHQHTGQAKAPPALVRAETRQIQAQARYLRERDKALLKKSSPLTPSPGDPAGQGELAHWVKAVIEEEHRLNPEGCRKAAEALQRDVQKLRERPPRRGQPTPPGKRAARTMPPTDALDREIARSLQEPVLPALLSVGCNISLEKGLRQDEGEVQAKP